MGVECASSRSRRRSAPLADDRSPARGVRPAPGARHEGLGAGERLAPLRERAGHRADRAGGGTPEGGGALSTPDRRASRADARCKARPTLTAGPQCAGGSTAMPTRLGEEHTARAHVGGVLR